MKKRYLSVVLLLTVVMIVSGCSQESTQKKKAFESKEGQRELVLALGPEPEDGFDPINGWGNYGAPLFQSTLLSYDADFNLIDDLAVDYNLSDDLLTWDVVLREGVKFSDGSELTVADVVYTFEKMKEKSSLVDLSNLEKIEIGEDNQVRFKLKTPNTTFSHVLATTGIFSERHYNEKYNEQPIGSGPYVLSQWDKSEQLIVEVNPYYYGAKPVFDRLIFLFMDEETALATAQKQQIDVLAVSPQNATIRVPNMSLKQFTSVDNRGITLPMTAEEPVEGKIIGNNVTSQLSIRQAMNIVINREEMVTGVLNGYGTKAFSVADQLPWWNEETVFTDNKIEEAKELLNKDGWKLNNQGELTKDNLVASFDLLYPTGDHVREALALTFKSQVAALGIAVNVQGLGWDKLEEEFYHSPTVMGWGSNTPMEMFNIYSSTTFGKGMYNLNNYKNLKVDEYFAKALTAETQAEANDFWRLAQWDGKNGFGTNEGDVPWIWLVNLEHLYLVNDNLEIGEQKIQPHGHGWPITDFITQWSLKNE